jgi:fructokinase
MKKIVLGLGEILWDLLPDGKVLGGAPANFAYHAFALGAISWPVSRVGADALGREILDRLWELRLPTTRVQVDRDAPTGTVSVEMLANGGHKFTIHENVAWDRMEASASVLEQAGTADAICFGTLAQRRPTSRAAIQAIASATPETALRIFDVNLRQDFYSRLVIEQSLKIANVLKINDEELPIVADLLGLRGSTDDWIAALADTYSLQMVALTRGAEGSLLYSDGWTSQSAGKKVDVVDTIGAGDAFTAALAMGRLAGWDLEEINEHANAIAAFVCTRPGATPSLPSKLKAPFRIV